MRPSTYTVVIEKAAFLDYRRTGIVLATGERVALRAIRLVVGQSSESITVRAETPPVRIEDADTARAIRQVDIQSVPIAGRDVMARLRVLPGTSSMPVASWSEVGANDPAGYSSNGGQFGSFSPTVSAAKVGEGQLVPLQKRLLRRMQVSDTARRTKCRLPPIIRSLRVSGPSILISPTRSWLTAACSRTF